MQHTPFNHWFDTPYYHLLYKNRNHKEAKAFVNNLINFLLPEKGASILDVACGKGRHAEQMAELEFHVTGIDLSTNSIKEATLLQHDKLEFFVHDMRKPFRINEYDFVFNFFTSFGYFDTDEENLNAMSMMSGALKNGGKLVMDYLNASRFSKSLSQKETKEIDGILFETEKKVMGKKIVKTIKIIDEINQLESRYAESVSLLTLDDFQHLAEKTGLKMTAVFGDYNLNPFIDSTSERLIMIFCKNSFGMK